MLKGWAGKIREARENSDDGETTANAESKDNNDEEPQGEEEATEEN